MNIATIIVHYNSPKLLIQRIEEVLTIDTELFIVDNGSELFLDLSTKEKYISKGVRILESSVNLGFGKAINLLIRHFSLTTKFDYLFLLNSDCKINKRYYVNIRKFIKKEKEVDIVAPLLYDGKSFYYGSILAFPFFNTSSIDNENFNYEKIKYSWPTAASLFIKTKIIQDDDLFDPYFFMYWEDADMILRFKAKGAIIRNFYVSNSQFFEHVPGTSSNKNITERYIWHLDGILYFINKHLSQNKLIKFLIISKFILKSLIDLQPNRVLKIVKRCS